jgi:hypothetical protein
LKTTEKCDTWKIFGANYAAGLMWVILGHTFIKGQVDKAHRFGVTREGVEAIRFLSMSGYMSSMDLSAVATLNFFHDPLHPVRGQHLFLGV